MDSKLKVLNSGGELRWGKEENRCDLGAAGGSLDANGRVSLLRWGGGCAVSTRTFVLHVPWTPGGLRHFQGSG